MIINKILTKFIGTAHEREIKKLKPIIDEINQLEPTLINKSDHELVDMAKNLKEKATKVPLDQLLIEAFALCREVADRRLGMLNIFKDSVEFDFKILSPNVLEEAKNAQQKESLIQECFSVAFYQELRALYPESRWPYRMRCFDVQLIGGRALHTGKIAEMKTGEGKTLVATLAAYLNALSGKGVHIITTNDYLAKVGSGQNRILFEFLDLSVGLVVGDTTQDKRKQSYKCDITYGTNNEFGFDYLRDNMVSSIEECVQRQHHYAIVDEVDSILIDEARTPLIISGPAEVSTDKYLVCNRVVKSLIENKHYTKDEKNKHVGLTEEGVNQCESQLNLDNLYADLNTEWVHHLTQALKAHVFFKKDVDYLIKNREIVIIDEFTGRLMEGRRYSEGLHQAIEAKEKVPIAKENQTLATITFQNYFRMYSKLSGMTGTAATEVVEFEQIYKLQVLVIPTHRSIQRLDGQDLIYRTEKEKLKAITDDIKERNQKGQPVLVGTVSVAKSELVSQCLKKAGIAHEILNAKQHEREANIIEQAGVEGHVTISTNMAGRGVDIKLTEKSRKLGGLFVLGTERHEARRIDNQLRGRSGRQGDLGGSQFYLSLEDDLMRVFGSVRIAGAMNRLGLKEGEVITHSLVTRSIAGAQKRVEGQNFETRKHLLKYDDVMNQQRNIIYKIRRQILEGSQIQEEIEQRINEVCEILLLEYRSANYHVEQWDIQSLQQMLKKTVGINLNLNIEEIRDYNADTIQDRIISMILERYQTLRNNVGEEINNIEQQLLLMIIDHFWKNHLYSMDHLKEAIRFRGYAQKDPLQEYKKEGFQLFENTLDSMSLAIVEKLMHLDVSFIDQQRDPKSTVVEINASSGNSDALVASRTKHNRRANEDKIGRNDPCICGSGKKYKKCCGQNG